MDFFNNILGTSIVCLQVCNQAISFFTVSQCHFYQKCGLFLFTHTVYFLMDVISKAYTDFRADTVTKPLLVDGNKLPDLINESGCKSEFFSGRAVSLNYLSDGE